jgi:transcriptional regulator with XRE-family HTH domain
MGKKESAQDADRHVGMRMRQQRIMIGFTQKQMAQLIGVTYQQAHKYEKGINRISAGRLYKISQALGVSVGWFFEGLGQQLALDTVAANNDLTEFVGYVRAIQPPRLRREMLKLTRAVAQAASEPERPLPRY